MMTRHYVIIACICCTVSGCTATQLRKDTVQQAVAVHDVVQQQVMDNLAMFVYDYNSMPYFSCPSQGGAQVVDQATAGGSVGWGRANNYFGTQTVGAAGFPLTVPLLLNAVGLSGSGQRSQQESFIVTPVNDPRKLELMRCAYQLAVRSCGRGAVSATCPDCQTRFKVFYTGDPNGDIRQGANGIVTSESLNSTCCWFHIGCKKCLPKHCPCIAVGEYCGCYVWVLPEGQDELTKLTLAILDYALHDPPGKRSKEIVYYVDEYGLPTTKQNSVGTVTANVAIDESPEGLLKMSQGEERALLDLLDYRHQHVKERLLATSSPEEQKALLEESRMLEAKLDFLKHQMRSGGLREQYFPRSPISTGPSVLQLDLYQNTLPNFGPAP
jgi:hypothetical protein